MHTGTGKNYRAFRKPRANTRPKEEPADNRNRIKEIVRLADAQPATSALERFRRRYGELAPAIAPAAALRLVE